MVKAFDGQREGEKVVLVFRRHILTSARGFLWLVVVSGLSVLPVVLWGGRMLPMMICGFVLGVVGWLYAYMLWYYSVYIVTNERLRQVNQKGLFKKSVTDVALVKIENVSYKVPGVMGGVMGYGTLLIQTMVGDMTVSMVRKPEKVYNKIQNVIAKAGNREGK